MGQSEKVEVGDTVKTLNRRVAVEGVVIYVNPKNGMARVKGSTYPGGPEDTVSAHVENVEIVQKGSK
jgi:hypothetical protein